MNGLRRKRSRSKRNASKVEKLENIGVAAARDPCFEFGWEAEPWITASRAPVLPLNDLQCLLLLRSARGVLPGRGFVRRSGPAQTRARPLK
jgi:hypothetical protein